MCDCESDKYNFIEKKFQYLLNVFKSTLEVDLGIFPIDLKSKRLETGSDCAYMHSMFCMLDVFGCLTCLKQQSESCCAFI